MSGKATLDRQAVQKFNSYWEDLMEEFPEARAMAVRTMGEAAQRELNAQIGKADLETDAKDIVVSWQELRLGSKGGYAALSAIKASPYRGGKKPKSWNGTVVTVRQITRWLERGHGVRKPDTTKDYAWSERRKNRNRRAGLNVSTGLRYVKGRMFYSWTKTKATDLALKAANSALERFAEGKGV